MDGYVDLQVNGYVGVDFNNPAVSMEDLQRVCSALVRDGVRGILATVVTAELDRMCACLSNLARLRCSDELAHRMIAGFHIEGPFLSPRDGYRGAHDRRWIFPADVGAAERLMQAGAGLVKVFTLAPEHDEDLRVTRMLAGQGVVVSAGHTDAPLGLLSDAIGAGLAMFTHLGNGCPLELDRHDNIIQRVLALAGKLTISFIGDLLHVPAVALGNYLRLVDPARVVIITDCASPAGAPPGRYRLNQWEVQVDESGAMWSPDRTHLLGSAATMPMIRRNLEGLGLGNEAIELALSANPARLIGLTEARPSA